MQEILDSVSGWHAQEFSLLVDASKISTYSQLRLVPAPALKARFSRALDPVLRAHRLTSEHSPRVVCLDLQG